MQLPTNRGQEPILLRDDIVTFEVMRETLDRDWWKAYKEELEESFRQEEIVIRKLQIEIL